jgi:hypothetical protein
MNFLKHHLLLFLYSFHLEEFFGIGLLLFLISVIVGITAVMWSIAGTADRTVRRFTDGDER